MFPFKLSWILDFRQNLKILSVHLSVAVYEIWSLLVMEYKRLNIAHTISHTHTYAQTILKEKKTLFGGQGTLKRINQVKSRYRKF